MNGILKVSIRNIIEKSKYDFEYVKSFEELDKGELYKELSEILPVLYEEAMYSNGVVTCDIKRRIVADYGEVMITDLMPVWDKQKLLCTLAYAVERDLLYIWDYHEVIGRQQLSLTLTNFTEFSFQKNPDYFNHSIRQQILQVFPMKNKTKTIPTYIRNVNRLADEVKKLIPLLCIQYDLEERYSCIAGSNGTSYCFDSLRTGSYLKIDIKYDEEKVIFNTDLGGKKQKIILKI